MPGGKTTLCCYIRKSPGVVNENNLFEVYNSKAAQKIRSVLKVIRAKLLKMPRRIIEYDDFVEYLNKRKLGENEIPLIAPNWDNTARCGLMGSVMVNSTPQKFDIMFKNALKKIKHKSPDEKIIFIEAWNEWAEGNYLEPDRKFGRQYLEVIKNNVFESQD